LKLPLDAGGKLGRRRFRWCLADGQGAVPDQEVVLPIVADDAYIAATAPSMPGPRFRVTSSSTVRINDPLQGDGPRRELPARAIREPDPTPPHGQAQSLQTTIFTWENRRPAKGGPTAAPKKEKKPMKKVAQHPVTVEEAGLLPRVPPVARCKTAPASTPPPPPPPPPHPFGWTRSGASLIGS